MDSGFGAVEDHERRELKVPALYPAGMPAQKCREFLLGPPAYLGDLLQVARARHLLHEDLMEFRPHGVGLYLGKDGAPNGNLRRLVPELGECPAEDRRHLVEVAAHELGHHGLLTRDSLPGTP